MLAYRYFVHDGFYKISRSFGLATFYRLLVYQHGVLAGVAEKSMSLQGLLGKI